MASKPPLRNSPRIAEFTCVAEDESKCYFLFVEQMVLCEVATFSKALFLWFSVLYVFHLSYCVKLNEVCMFIQEFVFGLPCSAKRSASYLSVVMDIQRNTVHWFTLYYCGYLDKIILFIHKYYTIKMKKFNW